MKYPLNYSDKLKLEKKKRKQKGRDGQTLAEYTIETVKFFNGTIHIEFYSLISNSAADFRILRFFFFIACL